MCEFVRIRKGDEFIAQVLRASQENGRLTKQTNVSHKIEKAFCRKRAGNKERQTETKKEYSWREKK